MTIKHLSPACIAALRDLLNLKECGFYERRALRRTFKLTSLEMAQIKFGRLTGKGPGRYQKVPPEKVEAVVREMRELGQVRNANRVLAEHHGLGVGIISQIRVDAGLRQRAPRTVSRPRHNLERLAAMLELE